MAVKKDNDNKTTKKTSTRAKTENKARVDVIETHIDVEEIKKELRQELNEYVDIKIRDGFNEKIDNANKRVIREKNKKIAFRNFVIIILILLAAFLTYLLYKADYFDKFFTDDNSVVETTKGTNSQIEQKEEVKAPTLEELTALYGNYLDTITISETSSYINDYYSGNLTSELKNYLAFNTIDVTTLTTDYTYNVIKDNIISDAYKKLFDTEYVAADFTYNNNKIRYIAMMESYLSDTLITKETSNIKREIINIIADEDVTITTIEGIVKDNKVYAFDNSELGEYSSLAAYKDKLNTIKYTFNKNKQLLKIEK